MNLSTGPGPEGYKAVLSRWREAWLALREHTAYDLSEINSIHILNSHLEDWYDMHGESLVKFSDHTVESAHQHIDKVMARTNGRRKDVESETHGRALYRVIMTHNTYVMDEMRLRV